MKWPQDEPPKSLHGVHPETIQRVRENVPCLGYYQGDEVCRQCPLANPCWKDSFQVMEKLSEQLERGVRPQIKNLEQQRGSRLPLDTSNPTVSPVNTLCYLCQGKVREGDSVYWVTGYGCRHQQCS